MGETTRKGNSLSREKKYSDKYRKQLFLDLLQNRSKTSKGLFDRKGSAGTRF
jgi:hypothetical protein